MVTPECDRSASPLRPHLSARRELACVGLTILYCVIVELAHGHCFWAAGPYAVAVFLVSRPKDFIRGALEPLSSRVILLYGLLPTEIVIGAGYLTGLVGIYSGDPPPNPPQRSLPETMNALVYMALLGPVVEELAFRFVFFRAVREKLSFLPAATVSSALFGVAHFRYPDPMKVVICIGAGVIFCWIYEKSKTILAPTLVHALNNAWMAIS